MLMLLTQMCVSTAFSTMCILVQITIVMLTCLKFYLLCKKLKSNSCKLQEIHLNPPLRSGGLQISTVPLAYLRGWDSFPFPGFGTPLSWLLIATFLHITPANWWVFTSGWCKHFLPFLPIYIQTLHLGPSSPLGKISTAMISLPPPLPCLWKL